jgi:hypothetical protein
MRAGLADAAAIVRLGSSLPEIAAFNTLLLGNEPSLSVGLVSFPKRRDAGRSIRSRWYRRGSLISS